MGSGHQIVEVVGMDGGGNGHADFERDRLARFILGNEQRIRALARQKLNDRTRSWTDSEDIVDSVYLRLDKLLQNGKLRYDTMEDLWPLIQIIAERRAIDRNRLASNAERLLSDEADHLDLVRVIREHPTADATDLFLRLLAKVGNGIDRQLMMLVLRGAQSKVAGELLGISAQAARQRWCRLRKELVEHLREERDTHA